ncbi:peptidoglycan-associated outer membrane lipoprotein [uncultured Alphaproteobacteria bacterium]|uniref:Peptidoglycan-associated lipoprotein n=1 Tax=uncultured Alphaproteobacteria bacterium TaxID=91750 RepID=A0A212JC17_9PROT|nr:peptidoglycan-associated outer membrane lipoprotein [uncultured Alphaproteobacteria bacterium]
MKIRVLSVVAASLLVAACSSGPQESADTSGAGKGAASSSVTAPVPGSPEHFLANAKDRVFFALDRSDLDESAVKSLMGQAAWLKTYPNTKITIEGHADERGTREYNLALGERRANAVKNFLQAQGVAAARITTVSYGKERPAVMGSNEYAWSQNRRAVTVVQK